MYNRRISNCLSELMCLYPVVTITGPRQSGKTTLARMSYPQMPYYNLEEPDMLALIKADPKTFFKNNSKGAILDEIQRYPELLSYIQGIVDTDNQPGKYLLTGSHQLQLHEAISQSLAGRTALLELYPLTISELLDYEINLSVDDYLLHGFYPAVHARQINPTVVYRNYIKTYVERDVRQLTNIRDLGTFQRFIRVMAGRVGNILNTESLSGEIGCAHNTIKNWINILEASYLIVRLQPYFENFGKRIIKSPKIYYTDVGVASYLLGMEETGQIQRDRLRGCLFENMILVEFIKHYCNLAKEPQLYYYRDNHGNEVDIVIKCRDKLIPIEIKSAATFSPFLLKNLKFYKKLVGDRVPIGFLVYTGDLEHKVEEFQLVNYKNLNSIFSELDKLS